MMVEYEKSFLESYKIHRPNSIHIINNATHIDYKKLLTDHNIPFNIDYLQIDLEPSNGSTIETLELLDKTVMDEYKFATVTFEHDIYCTNYKNTRLASREIFQKRGYVCVFADINNNDPKYVYEDWYVHPDLVDMDYINTLILNNTENYTSSEITGKTIDWKRIVY
jgi:hypothetical protein